MNRKAPHSPIESSVNRTAMRKPLVPKHRPDPLTPAVHKSPPPPPQQIAQRKQAIIQGVSSGPRKYPVAPPVYRPEAKKIVQPKAVWPQRKLPTAPPVYRAGQKQVSPPGREVPVSARTLGNPPSVHQAPARQATRPPGPPAQMKSKALSSVHPRGSTRVITVQRKASMPEKVPRPPSLRVQWQNRGVIQRVVKNLALGGTLDVEELDGDVWASRMFDEQAIANLKIWKRTGSTPAGYNGDTYYSGDDERLHALTADSVNAYWDRKYAGFTRSGSPTPLQNCEDYAKGGQSYRDGVTYDLDQETDRNRLQEVLEAGTQVLQLGTVRLTAHFLIAEKTDTNVTIRQKDGDSAIYHKVMTPQAAVEYIRTKHSKAIVLVRN